LIALLKRNRNEPGRIQKTLGRTTLSIYIKFKNLKGYRVNIAIDEYQELEGELPYDGTAELWWDSLEELQADFASPEGVTAALMLTNSLLCARIFIRKNIFSNNA
jgi:hypothetical protein